MTAELRAEIRQAIADLEVWDSRLYVDWLTALVDENERLEAALAALINSHWSHYCSDGGVGFCVAISWAKFCDAWDVLHPDNPASTIAVLAGEEPRMTATVDVQLPQSHPWANDYLPTLVGRSMWMDVTIDGSENARPGVVVGAVRLPPDIGGVIVKLEIP
jgi:hypothetical protein